MTEKGEQTNRPCCCPYCDAEMARAALPWCKECGVEVRYCPKCHEAIGRDDRICPHCSADIREEATTGEA